jgi:acyl-CoA reductase-like NAD-dependent aldehyde dehydrogenase
MTLPQKLLINGELIDTGLTLDVINPATGKTFVTVPRASEKEANAAVAAARAAYPAWSALPLKERRAKLAALADAVTANEQELARALTQEQGKPLGEALFEVQTTAVFLRHFANVDIPVKIAQDDETMRIEVHHKPLGVVVGITPWNFPLLITANKLAPALILGNTIVLKPAPTTPVTVLMLGALAQTIFPKGVVNILADSNNIGAVLTGHPDVNRISFTGSTATGKKIMQNAASTLKRVTLELGGNDAAIVLDDVDVEKIAPKMFGSAFFNCGQVCIALKRVYAHSSIYDKLCNALAREAEKAVVGDGLQEGTQIGPIQNAMQFEKIKGYLNTAKQGGKVIAGGAALNRPGYFVQPTIVRDIADDSPLVVEEQFGPILPILKFDDIDEALERANNTPYGLGGSVWSGDPQRAYEIARRIDSGTVWINHHLHFGPHVPFGGAKESGIGVEFGEEGLMEFSQTAVISIAK